MSRSFYSLLQTLAGRLGFIVQRRSGCDLAVSQLEVALLSALSAKGSLSIIQVGANDGKENDPIYRFVMEHRASTQVLLVEPMVALGAVLARNYAEHPHARIAHIAVGPRGSLTLFSVAPDFWSQCQPDYAKGWPQYRAPMGVTSTSREHVENFLRRHFNGRAPFRDVIQKTEVQAMPVIELARSFEVDRVDVLQIDAEGFDDEVLFSAGLDELRPLLINYEHASLTVDRRKNLAAHLRALGYVVTVQGRDSLAILDCFGSHLGPVEGPGDR